MHMFTTHHILCSNKFKFITHYIVIMFKYNILVKYNNILKDKQILIFRNILKHVYSKFEKHILAQPSFGLSRELNTCCNLSNHHFSRSTKGVNALNNF